MEATYRQSYLGGRDEPVPEGPAAPDMPAMSLQEIGAFMDGLEVRGVTFALDGGRLLIAAPPGALTAGDEVAIVRHREAIARLVRSAVTPWGQAAPAESAGIAVQLTMGEAA